MDVATIPTSAVDTAPTTQHATQTASGNLVHASYLVLCFVLSSLVMIARVAAADRKQKKGCLASLRAMKVALYQSHPVKVVLLFLTLFAFMFGATFGSGFGYLGGLLGGGIGLGIIVVAVGTLCGITMKIWWTFVFVMVCICGYSGGLSVGALLPGYFRVRDETFELSSVPDVLANPNAIANKFKNDVFVDVSVHGELEGRVRKIDICNVVAPLRDEGDPTGPSAPVTVVAICAAQGACADGGIDECLAWFQDPANVPVFGAARFDSPVIPYSIASMFATEYEEAVSQLRTRMDPGAVPDDVIVFRLIDWEAEQSRRRVGSIVASSVTIPLGIVFIALAGFCQNRDFEKHINLPPEGCDYDSD